MLRRLVPLLLALGAGSCGSSNSPASPTPAPPGATTITIVSGASTLTTTAFNPNPITVSVGTQVSFLNSDNTTHTSAANASTWNSGNIAPGGRFNVTLTTAGSYPYHCNIHPGMVGTINVQ
jgi:plastocyanin